MSTTTFTYEFNNETFKGNVNFPTGIFIDGQFSAGSNGTTVEYVPIVSLIRPVTYIRLLASSILVSLFVSLTNTQMF
jgi:predicted TIM-barrel enzyme